MTDNTVLTPSNVELIARSICIHLTEKSSLSDLRNSLQKIKLDPDKCRQIAICEAANVRRACRNKPPYTHESPDKNWLLIDFGHPVVGVSDVWLTPSGTTDPLHISQQRIQILGSA